MKTKIVIFTAVMAMTMVSCNKSDNGGTATTPVANTYGATPPAACSGCFPIQPQAQIFRAIQDKNGILSDVIFWGDTSTGFNFLNNPYPPVTNYVGSSQIQGFLEFRNAIGSGYCGIPVGRYELRSLAPVYWDKGVATTSYGIGGGLGVQGGLQAVMPGVTLTLSLNQFVVGPRPSGAQDWISLPRPHTGTGYFSWVIQAVNNQQCYLSISN